MVLTRFTVCSQTGRDVNVGCQSGHFYTGQYVSRGSELRDGWGRNNVLLDKRGFPFVSGNCKRCKQISVSRTSRLFSLRTEDVNSTSDRKHCDPLHNLYGQRWSFSLFTLSYVRTYLYSYTVLPWGRSKITVSS